MCVSGDRDVTAGSSHDFGLNVNAVSIEFHLQCITCLSEKWRIRIIKSSEEKNSLAVEVERPRRSG